MSLIRKKINAKIGASAIREEVLHGVLNENTDVLVETDWSRMNLSTYGMFNSVIVPPLSALKRVPTSYQLVILLLNPIIS